MAWGAIAGSVAGALISSSSGGGGGGGGGSGPIYVPSNLGGTDVGWQNAFNSNLGLANQAQSATAPAYLQSLQQSNALNYQPYLNYANQAGQQYANLAGTTQQGAQQAAAQQAALYGGGLQTYLRALDPNQAQFNLSQQQLADQINAGQAARGLGNSPVGGQEYNNAMSNFDIGWNTQQLQNQIAGLGALSGASSAGGQQGQLAQALGAAVPGYLQQAGSVPLQAQQTVAAAPGANASTYQQQMAALENMYQLPMSAAQGYMGLGGSAQAANANYNAQIGAQTAQGLGGLGTAIGQGLVSSYNTPGSWLNNLFGGSSGSTGSGDFGTIASGSSGTGYGAV